MRWDGCTSASSLTKITIVLGSVTEIERRISFVRLTALLLSELEWPFVLFVTVVTQNVSNGFTFISRFFSLPHFFMKLVIVEHWRCGERHYDIRSMCKHSHVNSNHRFTLFESRAQLFRPLYLWKSTFEYVMAFVKERISCSLRERQFGLIACNTNSGIPINTGIK